MKTTNNIFLYGESNLGRRRTNNEDAFIAQTIWDNENVLAVVIDGVGGYDGGEVAAAIAKSTIVEYLENFPNGERANLLKQAVIEANNEILKSRSESEEYKNMSCVLTAILVEAKKGLIHMAHIGDTRLYQYSKGNIVKLSHDHSLIGYREEVGELTEEEAMRHPQRNIIGRDVGSKYMEMDTDLVEMETFRLQSNSILLLCSDGLSDMITSSMMAETLSKDISIEYKTKELIEKANSEGGNDNVTVVLVQYTGQSFEMLDLPSERTITKNIDYKEEKIEINNSIEDKERMLSKIYMLLKINMVLLVLVLALLSLFTFRSYCSSETEAIGFEQINEGVNNMVVDTLMINTHVENKDSLNE